MYYTLFFFIQQANSYFEIFVRSNNVQTRLKELFWLCGWLLGFDIDLRRLQIARVICKQFS